jgi:hypothetical protein
VGAIRPSGPFPLLCLDGTQGGAKTSIGRVAVKLIDPRVAGTRGPAKNEDVSSVPSWLADALCRLSTGAGLSKRTHYTNDEETVLDATRPVILNGRSLTVPTDLRDRMILLTLERIPDKKRRPESELWEEFEKACPRILGVLLNAVSAALRNLPTVSLAEYPRMADFAAWVSAAEQGLGWPKGRFHELYGRRIRAARAEILENDPLARAVLRLMQARAEWEGNATELAAALREAAEPAHASRLPSAQKMRGALTIITPELEDVGIAFRPLSHRRLIRLERAAERHDRHDVQVNVTGTVTA